MSLKGKSQMMSLFRTKNGSSSSLRMSRAKAKGPAATQNRTFNNSLSTWLPHTDAYTAAHFLPCLQQCSHPVVRQVAAAKTKTVETKVCTDMSKVAVMLLGAARWKRKCCSMYQRPLLLHSFWGRKGKWLWVHTKFLSTETGRKGRIHNLWCFYSHTHTYTQESHTHNLPIHQLCLPTWLCPHEVKFKTKYTSADADWKAKLATGNTCTFSLFSGQHESSQGVPFEAHVLCPVDLLGFVDHFYTVLFSAFQADSLHLQYVILHEWIAFYSYFLNIHWNVVLTALTWLVLDETAAISACCVYTIQPCTMSLHAKPHT